MIDGDIVLLIQHLGYLGYAHAFDAFAAFFLHPDVTSLLVNLLYDVARSVVVKPFAPDLFTFLDLLIEGNQSTNALINSGQFA